MIQKHKKKRAGEVVSPARRLRAPRDRFGPNAPWVAVLVFLVLACVGLAIAVVQKTQIDTSAAARETTGFSSSPLATQGPTSTGPVIAVVGDDSTSATRSGVTSAQRWDRILASSLGARVVVEASGGMGYVSKGNSGETFVQAAAQVPTKAEVVVFFGGAADANVSSLSVVKAATAAYSAASQQAPAARLIVVGPVVAAGASKAELLSIRDALRSSAGIARAEWVDPIGSSWLSPGTRDSPAADLTAADETVIATRIEKAVKKALR